MVMEIKLPVVEPTTRIDFPRMLFKKIESAITYRRSQYKK